MKIGVVPPQPRNDMQIPPTHVQVTQGRTTCTQNLTSVGTTQTQGSQGNALALMNIPNIAGLHANATGNPPISAQTFMHTANHARQRATNVPKLRHTHRLWGNLCQMHTIKEDHIVCYVFAASSTEGKLYSLTMYASTMLNCTAWATIRETLCGRIHKSMRQDGCH